MENKVIKAGTKIVFDLYVGMAGTGTGAMEACILTQDYTENELADMAWERGIEHADMYGVCPQSDLDSMTDEELEDIDESDYSDNIEGSWELYDEEKHAGHCMTGIAQEVHFHEI